MQIWVRGHCFTNITVWRNWFEWIIKNPEISRGVEKLFKGWLADLITWQVYFFLNGGLETGV